MNFKNMPMHIKIVIIAIMTTSVLSLLMNISAEGNLPRSIFSTLLYGGLCYALGQKKSWSRYTLIVFITFSMILIIPSLLKYMDLLLSIAPFSAILSITQVVACIVSLALLIGSKEIKAYCANSTTTDLAANSEEIPLTDNTIEE